MSLSLKGDSVVVTLPWRNGELYRGYRPPSVIPGENKKQLAIQGEKAIDEHVPDNVELHYLARGPQNQMIRAQLTIPSRPLPSLGSPTLQIDKFNYTLDVIDNDKTRKRYPIALGQNPVNRKFCQDMASTPEGWYEVYNLQPDATYHKALDIDYPRPIDHVRHQLAIDLGLIEAGRPIGGEIQIHGWGIESNWTAGCIALRDEDMDELFSEPAIRSGMPVFIAGQQLRTEDRSWLLDPPPASVKTVQKRLRDDGYYGGEVDGQFGNATARALGQYQNKHGIPLSCQLDSLTRQHFGL
jgi:L,D-transpeptidase catalytic domain/Putative peptidoglycan binding domain